MKLEATCDESTLDIEGSAEGLRDLARQIEQCSGTCELLLTKDPAKKTVGLGNTRTISILLGAGPVNIFHSQGAVTISGSKQKLNVLAENILWLANQDGGSKDSEITNHIHVEYHPGHFYLAETAIPMVLSRVDTEGDETPRPKQQSIN